jgi:hypothetical protein
MSPENKPDSYPQPHEGVTGADRLQDDLLDLDEGSLRRRAAMLRISCALWKATLNGANTEYGRAGYQEMTHPRIGDLVAEVGALRGPELPDHDGEARLVTGFGILLGDRTEWNCSHETWDREVADGVYGEGLTLDDRATTRAFYVQYGPKAADVCRWVNCDLAALPTGALHPA